LVNQHGANEEYARRGAVHAPQNALSVCDLNTQVDTDVKAVAACEHR
jgi:hypothetical protein